MAKKGEEKESNEGERTKVIFLSSYINTLKRMCYKRKKHLLQMMNYTVVIERMASRFVIVKQNKFLLQ